MDMFTASWTRSRTHKDPEEKNEMATTADKQLAKLKEITKTWTDCRVFNPKFIVYNLKDADQFADWKFRLLVDFNRYELIYLSPSSSKHLKQMIYADSSAIRELLVRSWIEFAAVDDVIKLLENDFEASVAQDTLICPYNIIETN